MGRDMENLLVPLEFRADETRESPGMLAGVLMSYGSRANDRPEMFEQGAFHWRESGIIIREQHNREAPIVRGIPYLEGKELRIEIPLPNTSRGRDAATNMRGPNPLYGGLSVEFNSEQETRRAGLRVITRAFLDGAGLVDNPSYLTSTVEVRGEQAFEPRSILTWL